MIWAKVSASPWPAYLITPRTPTLPASSPRATRLRSAIRSGTADRNRGSDRPGRDPGRHARHRHRSRRCSTVTATRTSWASLLDGARAGIAYAELSTGEFAATQIAAGSRCTMPHAAVVSRNRAPQCRRGRHAWSSDVHRAQETASTGCLNAQRSAHTEPWRWRAGPRRRNTEQTILASRSSTASDLPTRRLAMQAAGRIAVVSDRYPAFAAWRS